jgi:hypothetical protein
MPLRVRDDRQRGSRSAPHLDTRESAHQRGLALHRFTTGEPLKKKRPTGCQLDWGHGILETHGRIETETLLQGLEVWRASRSCTAIW